MSAWNIYFQLKWCKNYKNRLRLARVSTLWPTLHVKWQARYVPELRGAFKKFVDSRLAQLTTRYADHILSLFNIVSCNCNALGPAFLQSSDPVVEELLFLFFQPAIYRADNVLVVRKFAFFHEFFQFRKNRSHLAPAKQRTWSHVSSSTVCHTKCRLELLRHSSLIIRVRIARQMAGWKTRNNHSSTTQSELWRNAGPSAFQLQVTMLKSDKIWYAYVSLWGYELFECPSYNIRCSTTKFYNLYNYSPNGSLICRSGHNVTLTYFNILNFTCNHVWNRNLKSFSR